MEERGDAAIRAAIERALERAGRVADELEAMSRRSDITADDWLRSLGRLGTDMTRLRRALNKVSPTLDLPGGAHDRILRYLQLRVGEVVSKDELEGVAGISEWARRVRELRVEAGWQISTNGNRSDLRPGEYVLESREPDADLAGRWRTANVIRRHPGGAKERILEFFLSCPGQTVSKDEVAYVAKIADYPRRVRELSEDGYQIASHLDSTDLRPGEYMLRSEERLPARTRQAIKQRYAILERDGYRCTICGSPPGPGRVLQVHHRLPVHLGGANGDDNLITLCQVCHAGTHAVGEGEVGDELLRPELEPTA
jgi:hypothetical protein